MHQNRVEGYEGDAYQTYGRTPPARGHPGQISGPINGARPGVQHARHGDDGRGTPLWRWQAGGGGSLVILQHWILRFRAASEELRLTVTDFGEWLANGRTPWAAYPAFMSGRLIVPDKQTRFRPVRLQKTWRRLMVKCVLRVLEQNAKAACGTKHLGGGVEVGIEGVIHNIRFLWSQHSQE